MIKVLASLLALIVVAIALMGAFPERTAELAFRAERFASGLEYRTTTVDGETWHYLEGGPPDADVVVLLHGFGGEKDNWTRFLKHLTQDYRVVAPDLPGFGESARHADWDYSLVPQRNRVLGFVDAIGLTRFHLAGHSMGGHLSILYASAFPEQVTSLALLNNSGIDAPVESDFLTKAKQGDNALIIRSQQDFDAMMTIVFEEPPFAPWPMKNVMADKLIRDADFNEKIFAALLRDLETDLEPVLADITAPVFILWGDRDRLLDVSTVDVMQNAQPRADVVVMENTGHMPILEWPAETAGYYRAFLELID